MKLLNKISTYSLVTAGFALTISLAPNQAQAINLVGQTSTSGAGLTASNFLNFRGQTLDFTIGGTLPGTTRPGVVVNSVKFALNSTSTNAAKSFVAYIYDISLGLPSIAELNAGTGNSNRLATSASAVTVGPDNSFIGTNTSYISLTFTGGTPELVTSKTYGIFLSLANNSTGFTATNEAIRGVFPGPYSGGIAYIDNGSLTAASGNADAAFIVDATPVPFEFEATGGVAVLGGLFLANKLRKRNQKKVEIDDQA